MYGGKKPSEKPVVFLDPLAWRVRGVFRIREIADPGSKNRE